MSLCGPIDLQLLEIRNYLVRIVRTSWVPVSVSNRLRVCETSSVSQVGLHFLAATRLSLMENGIEVRVSTDSRSVGGIVLSNPRDWITIRIWRISVRWTLIHVMSVVIESYSFSAIQSYCEMIRCTRGHGHTCDKIVVFSHNVISDQTINYLHIR